MHKRSLMSQESIWKVDNGNQNMPCRGLPKLRWRWVNFMGRLQVPQPFSSAYCGGRPATPLTDIGAPVASSVIGGKGCPYGPTPHC